jgi:Zn finger protein HypA/HybF involved in hydrogenase expression
MQAYCMKCRREREIQNPRSVVLKNKRPATRGVCPVCGTKMVRIGKS